MSLSDPIADMLTRIRNACKSRLPTVDMQSSRLKVAVCEVLQSNGYIEAFAVEGDERKKQLCLTLKYLDGTPVIEGIRRISSPSRRVYVSSQAVPRVLGGLGVAILSTPKGVMSDRAARKEKLGGEVLCYVW